MWEMGWALYACICPAYLCAFLVLILQFSFCGVASSLGPSWAVSHRMVGARTGCTRDHCKICQRSAKYLFPREGYTMLLPNLFFEIAFWDNDHSLSLFSTKILLQYRIAQWQVPKYRWLEFLVWRTRYWWQSQKWRAFIYWGTRPCVHNLKVAFLVGKRLKNHLTLDYVIQKIILIKQFESNISKNWSMI